ncbi:DUF4124 domain-containing protein [Wenzhouxiangella marina]|uniref:DUF4124 domain-containing protein n=1 Tax=Wenzhouxiangella marina TaxID=1579979 RepID=A0A0K0XS90_9GAMM|nr:DUF4124 domain-containing protein [Wenzhouxiangella marina]AKS40553.1 hypothetical protein WM2015_164 [Wenzhouxiangella marina]MBB6088321.1 uncharacterized protein YukE [Wenzhouxiangella marina]
MMKYALIILTLTLIPELASAQTVYRWVDDEGEVHYGHAVPPEYKDRGYDRLGPNGMVVERVERALTPEEQAARDRERERQAREEIEQRNQETRDRLLLAAYRSAEDIVTTRDMTLRSLASQRETLQTSLDRTSQRFENLVSRAAQLTREGQSVPRQLSENIAQAQAEVRDLREAMAQLDEREQEQRERFDADLARFLQLTQPDAGTAAESEPEPESSP